MRIVVIVGTRPEVIKMAPVIRALRQWSGTEVLVAGSAQHDTMLHQQLVDRGIKLDYTLAEMWSIGRARTLSHLMADLLLTITPTLQDAKPDLVLVQGDTTTTLAGALSAFHLGIPLGHVEAGIRSGDIREPFPEEINRRLVAQLATLHFAPTELAAKHLREESGQGFVWVTGNTVVDALWDTEWKSFPGVDVLVTCHRREALDKRLGLLIEQISKLARENPHIKVLWPLHANPAIVEAVSVGLMGLDNVRLLGSLPYTTFVQQLRRTVLVVTDSGGVIEEATTLGRRLLIIRDRTERPEALIPGRAELVPLREMPQLAEKILWGLKHLEEVEWSTVFGDGAAGVRIARLILDWWSTRPSAATAGRL